MRCCATALVSRGQRNHTRRRATIPRIMTPLTLTVATSVEEPRSSDAPSPRPRVPPDSGPHQDRVIGRQPSGRPLPRATSPTAPRVFRLITVLEPFCSAVARRRPANRDRPCSSSRRDGTGVTSSRTPPPMGLRDAKRHQIPARAREINVAGDSDRLARVLAGVVNHLPVVRLHQGAGRSCSCVTP